MLQQFGSQIIFGFDSKHAKVSHVMTFLMLNINFDINKIINALLYLLTIYSK